MSTRDHRLEPNTIDLLDRTGDTLAMVIGDRERFAGAAIGLCRETAASIQGPLPELANRIACTADRLQALERDIHHSVYELMCSIRRALLAPHHGPALELDGHPGTSLAGSTPRHWGHWC